MASVSSSAARSLIRDGKSAVNLLFRVRTATLTETMQNNGTASFRSLLRYNQTPASQYPVFPITFPVMQTGLRVGVVKKEDVSGKMEAAHGKRVVDKEDVDSEEEETDFDEEEIDDMDIEDFEDFDEDDDEEEEHDKYTRKKK